MGKVHELNHLSEAEGCFSLRPSQTNIGFNLFGKMDKLIVNAVDYISLNGGEWIRLVILPLGGLLLILKVIVDFKKNLSIIWVPKKPIKLADYELDKHSKTAQEILEYNEMLAFENTWGIHAERERREQLIVLKNRFG